MDADPAAAPVTLCPNLWAACEERAVVRLTLADGQVLTGNYTSRVGLHFLHRTGRDLPLVGEVTGPYGPGDVLAVEVVCTRAQVLADAHVRLHGERVPGREPATRDDHEHRMRVLARAVADAEADWQRQVQLHRQFREAADRIGLAQGKRTWLLHVARWARRSNAPPTMADLWVEPVASPSCLARPRPQDFDRDPRLRTDGRGAPPRPPRRAGGPVLPPGADACAPSTGQPRHFPRRCRASGEGVMSACSCPPPPARRAERVLLASGECHADPHRSPPPV